MANQNMRYGGWCPSNNYQVEEVSGPAFLRKRSSYDRPQQHQKGHVAFRTNLEEPITVEEPPLVPVPEAEVPTITKHANVFLGVDQKADQFIKSEHKRIELARLKSLGLV
ncbi:hypothetical protein RJT34_10595 [Clitoria ternatea]|uniref:Uncharacterized protein n=1 Tax=Clitoria ternatea TaxID=43366 RepID=A0AAN9K705_CLITE